MHRGTLQFDLSRIGQVYARKDLDEGRFSGAVLAESACTSPAKISRSRRSSARVPANRWRGPHESVRRIVPLDLAPIMKCGPRWVVRGQPIWPSTIWSSEARISRTFRTSGGPAHHRAVKCWSTDKDRICSEAKGGDDIGAASDGTVEGDLRTIPDGRPYRRQDIDRCWRSVQLAGVVIRDHGPLGAPRHGSHRVFRMHQTLDEELARPDASHVIKQRPGKGFALSLQSPLPPACFVRSLARAGLTSCACELLGYRQTRQSSKGRPNDQANAAPPQDGHRNATGWCAASTRHQPKSTHQTSASTTYRLAWDNGISLRRSASVGHLCLGNSN